MTHSFAPANRLSAHLAEATQNKTYQEAAVLSATFLRNVLLAPSGLMYIATDLSNCATENNTFNHHDSGYAMHAWSVMADIDNNTEWQNLYVTFQHILTRFII